jgi:hypothetical protein
VLGQAWRAVPAEVLALWVVLAMVVLEGHSALLVVHRRQGLVAQ